MELLSYVDDVQALAAALRARGWRLASAESCTGGLIAAACTALAGSSDWFDRGFVTYSNQAKTEMLGVSEALLQQHGAVSQPVALAMVQGALQHSHADLAVAVTGIAGPGGAVPGKPVGTVWLAWGLSTTAAGVLEPAGQAVRANWAERLQLEGDRDAVRGATLRAALQRLLQVVR
jgi:nicotinamide-nucleotide amidase